MDRYSYVCTTCGEELEMSFKDFPPREMRCPECDHYTMTFNEILEIK